MISTTKEFLHFHLTLQLHHTVKDCFRTRRATRDVNIYRNQLVNTTYHVVALLERSATNRATTNGHHVFRLCNLVIETLEHRRHFVGNSTCAHNQVSLTRRVTGNLKAKRSEERRVGKECR